MKLLINTASTFKGGGVQVALSFLEECKSIPGNEYHVIYGNSLNDLINVDSFPSNFTFYFIHFRPAQRVFSLKPGKTFFREIEKKIQPDAVFTTSGPAYWRPKAPHLAGYNLPHYIYWESPYFKMIPVLNKMKWYLKGKVIRHFFKKDADAYVVQSDDVNQRLKNWLGTGKVYTVSNTCSSFFRNPPGFTDKLPGRKKGEFRLLTLSAWYPHKNIDIIPLVIEYLPEYFRPVIRFVLTLPDETYLNIIPEKFRSYVYNTGPVSPEECASLYSECDALFMPSLLECFSASYPESMIMKKPIITTGLGFAKGICREAALYFEPANPKSAADTIIKIADDKSLQQKLIEKGLDRLTYFSTPAERAEKYLQICKKMVKEI